MTFDSLATFIASTNIRKYDIHNPEASPKFIGRDKATDIIRDLKYLNQP